MDSRAAWGSHREGGVGEGGVYTAWEDPEGSREVDGGGENCATHRFSGKPRLSFPSVRPPPCGTSPPPPISHELFLTGLSRPGHTPGSRGQACPPLPLTSCIPLGQPTWRSLRQPCRGKVHQKPCPLSPGVSLCLQVQALGAVLGPSDFQAPLPL